MLQLDYRGPRPIYEQIRQEFMRLILSGAIAPGEKLPSVRELAAQLSINPNTIQRAYRELEREGYIYTAAGRGAFCADWQQAAADRQRLLLGQMKELCRELERLGMTRGDILAALEKEDPHA